MENQSGYIYILTNQSFPEYVKIGYADNVDERIAQLNRSECTPFAFRKYAVCTLQAALPIKMYINSSINLSLNCEQKKI